MSWGGHRASLDSWGECVKQHQPYETALGWGEEFSWEMPHVPDQGYTQLHRHLSYLCF